MMKNRTILITGGTGSLGKALATCLGKQNKLVVYSRNEERQYEMMKEFSNPRIIYRIGDIRDTETLKYALRGCDLLIHAAAMKDLIMIEEQPSQGVLNNIEGTRSVVQAVIETPSVKKAVAISTDKAASPSNTYGMTKYIMERIFIEADNNSDKDFVCSRFGNMIDSSGSLPMFWKKHPEMYVGITDPDMCRFFFTLRDAVDTVLYTIEHAKGGEIYIPKMKAAKILDILQIIFKKEEFDVIGLFPGEKIHEDLVGETERYFCFDVGKYYVLRPGIRNKKITEAFSTRNAELFNKKELKNILYK
jgi:UDP-N-acetylglucosamine 4,6-dehydratase/5-epimerase